MMKTKLKLTAVFEPVAEGGYIGYIEELAGINTQGDSLAEVKTNLIEALELVIETQRELSEQALSQKNVIREEIIIA